MADFLGTALAPDIVRSALVTEYAATVAQACADRGIDPAGMALTQVRATEKPGEEYDFPFAWVGAVPDGQVVSGGVASVTTVSRVTAFVADRNPDPDVLAARLQAHLIALMRTFLWRESDAVTAHVTDYSGTPAFAPDDTTWIGSVGIEIEVTVTEDID